MRWSDIDVVHWVDAAGLFAIAFYSILAYQLDEDTIKIVCHNSLF